MPGFIGKKGGINAPTEACLRSTPGNVQNKISHSCVPSMSFPISKKHQESQLESRCWVRVHVGIRIEVGCVGINTGASIGSSTSTPPPLTSLYVFGAGHLQTSTITIRGRQMQLRTRMNVVLCYGRPCKSLPGLSTSVQ
jgi:hypothetical protein